MLHRVLVRTAMRPLSMAAIASADSFPQRVDATLKHVSDGLENMRDQNDVFSVELTDSSLVLDVGTSGMFSIFAADGEEELVMTTPLGSVHKYRWEPENEFWRDTADAHNMIELLTRDLLEVCGGYPTF